MPSIDPRNVRNVGKGRKKVVAQAGNGKFFEYTWNGIQYSRNSDIKDLHSFLRGQEIIGPIYDSRSKQWVLKRLDSVWEGNMPRSRKRRYGFPLASGIWVPVPFQFVSRLQLLLNR